MEFFSIRGAAAHCEEVPLSRLARELGTPLYVYSRAAIARRCEELAEAFRPYPTLFCYAVKANGNLSVLREIFSHGYGADVVSQGEMERALLAGASPDRIVFSGVGKRADEIVRALEVGILAFNVESEAELDLIAAIAERAGKRAPINLRINPHIDAKTNPHIATGLYHTKFGIPEKDAKELLPRIAASKSLSLLGLACHIGSQITEAGPFREAARRMASLAAETAAAGHRLMLIDLGGGLGIRYHDETPPAPREYAEALLKPLRGGPLKLLVEPGRCIVGEAGIILTKVLHVKRMPGKTFVIVDAAMNDLIRPSLYDAYHEVSTVAESTAAKVKTDIVGPVCETGDYIGRDRDLPECAAGDLLMIHNCGAYGSSMASNYNTRPRAAEVLVDGGTYKVIRRRERLDELWEGEIDR